MVMLMGRSLSHELGFIMVHYQRRDDDSAESSPNSITDSCISYRIKYFTTSIPGAGIFLPIARATKRASLASSESVATTPPSVDTVHPRLNSIPNRQTPTTPSIAPKFSQSVGPGHRAPSPAFRPKSRPSLPRPESPLRRAQNVPATPNPAGGRPSLGMLSSNRLGPAPRFAPSPTPGKAAPGPVAKTSKTINVSASGPTKPPSRAAMRDDVDEVTYLRNLLDAKNEKIAQITAEFDAHRSDFRSTLDTLELASTETERVYERKVAELLDERQALLNERQQMLEEREQFLNERTELETQSEDVESVAFQLRQLEEVVQELEEGLEDARRGEAEARGEVEFLRGEVERVRAELRGERERKARESISNGNGMSAGRAGLARARGSSSMGMNGASGRRDSVSSEAETRKTQVREAEPDADADKWCALCEGLGHDSISCPFEKA
jgi:hypothetical protein